nr:MAG TPA: hypothetical protein [Caudoviricetes sp.]
MQRSPVIYFDLMWFQRVPAMMCSFSFNILKRKPKSSAWVVRLEWVSQYI